MFIELITVKILKYQEIKASIIRRNNNSINVFILREVMRSCGDTKVSGVYSTNSQKKHI
jgi:hypothetical protein